MPIKLTDKKFYSELLDLEFEGLSEIKECIKAENYKAAGKVFASFLRNYLNPETFFSSFNEGSKVELTDELLDKAEKACRHSFDILNTPYDFGSNPIDWEFNPTYNNFAEWPFVLNRHFELLTLAKAYRATKNEKYAYACAELLSSWLDKAEAPPVGTSWGATNTWRTLECGIRLSEVWPEIIFSLYNSEALTDDLLVDIIKSIWEQGRRSRFEHREKGNWLIYAMTGVCCAAVMYPFLKDSKEWLSYSLETLKRELKRQVHPDGFQFELTTGYQLDVAICYINVLKVLKAFGHGFEESIAATVEKLLETYVYLTMPNGKVPDINDGAYFSTKEILSPYMNLFPENKLIKWAVSDGKEGLEPPKNHIFENAGLGVTRTGWGEKDTYVFFDGGEYAAGHQHEDKLNLLMYADGKMTLTEGGNYAYDTSDMRLYVRSTKAHNTVLVDNLNQNRGISYKFPDTEKISDLKGSFTESVDVLTSFYNDGYGNEGEKLAFHERKLYFIKKENGLKPFLIVADRLISRDEKEHLYSFLWHLDSEKLLIEGNNLKSDSLNLMVPKCDISLSIIKGQHKPETQGFYCSCEQLKYRPINCAIYNAYCKEIRLISLFYPQGDGENPIERIEASTDISDTLITIIKKNGEKFILDESNFTATNIKGAK